VRWSCLKGKETKWRFASSEHRDLVESAKCLDLFIKEKKRYVQEQIAVDHLKKCLRRARQFSEAMDKSAQTPVGLKYYLVVSDSEDTDKTARINSNSSLTIVEKGPGDGTVLRSSALLDERRAENQNLRLVSPIPWTNVMFLFSSYRDITNDPFFTDNLLYILLEKPREPKL
jgi:hypothetical protein